MAAKAKFWNIPNVISVGRVLVVPAIVVLLATIRPHDISLLAWNKTASLWATILFIIAAASDIVDGYIARRYDAITVFGKLFDPLADKLLTFGALIMLIPLGRMSAWIAVIVLCREVAVTTLRGIATSEGIVIAADKWGKMKNAFNNVGLVFLLYYYPLLGIEMYYTGWAIFFISVVLAIGSGLQYGIRFFQELTAREEMA